MARALPDAAADSDGPAALTARLTIHVVPRARETAVAGRHGDAIRIRVAAAPADNAANHELVRFLADRLKVPRSAVTIVGGRTSRRKTVSIVGRQLDEVLNTLSR